MNKSSRWVTAVVVVGFIAWGWYEEQVLWAAARQHYIGPILRSPEKLNVLIAICEKEAGPEGITLSPRRDMLGWDMRWEQPWLERGDSRLVGSGLEWPHKYAFSIVIAKVELHQGTVFGRIGVCKYDPERNTVDLRAPN